MKWPFLMLAFLAAIPSAADAAACQVTATPLSFGTYMPLSGGHRNSTADVSVTCNSARLVTIKLNAGMHSGNDYSRRAMRNGGFYLSYQLYSNPPRTTVWGDGTGGTVEVELAAPGSATIYGQIPARQAVGAGTYTDTVRVTVTF